MPGPVAHPGQQVQEAAERLACYDRQFGAPDNAKELPAKGSLAPVVLPTSAAHTAAAGRDPAPVVRSSLSKEWELSASEKRGTFVVRTYLPAYFMPIHDTSSLGPPAVPCIRRCPLPATLAGSKRSFSSPCAPKSCRTCCCRTRIFWFSYTQVALWQLWDGQDSRPMRSSDYEPQVTYVIPLGTHAWSHLPHDWDWRMVQLGIAHQSNGQSDPLSRDWNHLFAATVIEREGFGLQFRVDQRVLRSGVDDNPDLVRFIGHESVKATWHYGRVDTALSWRTNLGAFNTGAVQLDWSYPMRVEDPDGIPWYVQAFSGFGETLIDYNRRQTSVGFGLALFQF